MDQQVSSPEVQVDLIKVSKNYPPNINALTDITFSVKKGELVFLIGRSGAGKTTLLKLISRVEKPTRGLVEIGGVDTTKIPKRKMYTLRRKIGMAYQDFKLLPDRTVATNIAVSMEVVYRKKAFIQKRTRELLDRMDLQAKINTLASELSRGEQQRVAIARAVANYPEMVLADEPTGNLDAETTSRVMDLFHDLNNNGTTILIATHDRSIYNHGQHRIIRLHHGRQIDEAETTPEIFTESLE